jgi:hypothetical protein
MPEIGQRKSRDSGLKHKNHDAYLSVNHCMNGCVQSINADREPCSSAERLRLSGYTRRTIPYQLYIHTVSVLVDLKGPAHLGVAYQKAGQIGAGVQRLRKCETFESIVNRSKHRDSCRRVLQRPL